MRDILTDLVRQTKDLFEQIKITGTAENTKVEAVDKDKTLFLLANLKTPLAELEGEFGVTNLFLLEGLLNHSPYKADKASFLANREVKNGAETVTSFEFKDENGEGASFKTMAANLVTAQAQIADNIPWQVTVVPSKSKIAELAQLYKLFSEVDNKAFKISTKNKNLVFSLGEDNASTHNVSMVFEGGVTGNLTGAALLFDTGLFLNLTKIAGANPTTLHITGKGVLGMVMQTPTGTYNYYLRAKR